MGYIPFSYFQEAGDAVKGSPSTTATAASSPPSRTSRTAEYTPLGRPLFVYASDTALARPRSSPSPSSTSRTQGEIAELAEFVPMTDEQVDEARPRSPLAGG
jgi:phosphate transport system substrate-binding protein